MDKIKIVSDSTCDLPEEVLKKYDIDVIPLCVIMGDEEYFDGVTVRQSDIYDYVSRTKQLPKTAARSREDFKEFFEGFIKQGYTVIYCGIGNELSASFGNAAAAAKELPMGKVYTVDSCNLSSAAGLLCLHAAELAKKGKSASEIVAVLRKRAPEMQCSFVVDTLEYLYRGGRCSALAMFGANLLRLHPQLQLVDGKISVVSKHRGKMDVVFKKYIDAVLEKYNRPDASRCVIVHSEMASEDLKAVIEYVRSKNIFKEILEFVAGSVITCHCGKNTMGIMYFNDAN